MLDEVFPILRALLIQHEGYREQVYLDTVGHRTIGVGHNIDADPAWPEGKTEVHYEEAMRILQEDMDVAVSDCYALFDNYNDLPCGVKVALADMAFNLGRTRLAGFQHLKEAIEDMDFEAAAEEALDSRWARQVGQRARFLAELIRAHD